MNNTKNILRRVSNTFIPWVKQNNIKQININKASNVFIYNNKRKIVDFTSGAMAVNLGHNNSYILDGFNNHLKTGISYVPSNFSTYERDKLSSRIIEHTHKKGRVFFTNAGADANECAIFTAQEYFNLSGSKKSRVISFNKSFHGGSTIGASLISGDKRLENKDKFYELSLEPIMENPNMKDEGKASLKQIEKLLQDDVCAILIEGSSGSAGCILYPPDYLKKLEKLCNKYNVLIICDEVMSGWGRTGSLFAYQKHDINPDIITTAKGITSGYSPLGAVIINEKVSDMFNDNPLMYGLTYSGHILPCTIANRCFDLYTNNYYEIIRNTYEKTDIIEKMCNNIFLKYPFIKDFRNNGMLGCFEIDNNNNELLERICFELLNNNIYCLRIRNNIFIAPPLIIDNEILIDTIDKIDMIFERILNIGTYNEYYK